MAKVRITKNQYETILKQMESLGKKVEFYVYQTHKDYAGRPQFDKKGKQPRPATVRQNYVTDSEIKSIEVHNFYETNSRRQYFQFV